MTTIDEGSRKSLARDTPRDEPVTRGQVRVLYWLVIVLFGMCGMLTLAVLWLLIPHGAYIQNVRTQQLDVIGPGQSHPAVTISSGPDGNGAIVVMGAKSVEPTIVIGSDQHSVGVITLLVPNETGTDEPHVQLSATEGVLQSTGKVVAWRLGQAAGGGEMLFADVSGLVFAKLHLTRDGSPELFLTDRQGRSVNLKPKDD